MNCEHCLKTVPDSQKHHAVLCVQRDIPILIQEAKDYPTINKQNLTYGAKRQRFSAPTDHHESQQSRSSEPKHDRRLNPPRGEGYSRGGGYQQRSVNFRGGGNPRGGNNTRGGSNHRGGTTHRGEGKPPGYNPGNRLQKNDLAAVQAYFLQATKELKDSIQPHLAAIVSTIKDKAPAAEGNSTGAPH